jgi:hypothetical protein
MIDLKVVSVAQIMHCKIVGSLKRMDFKGVLRDTNM